MYDGDPVMYQKADERLKTQLEQKLSSHGVRPPCKVTVTVRNGVVTLAGTVQYDHQKRTIAHACRATNGVKHVIDNVQVPPPKPAWADHKPHVPIPSHAGMGHTAATHTATSHQASAAPGDNTSTAGSTQTTH